MGEPAFSQKRSSADGENEPRAESTLIKEEASPALYGPTPSGPHPFRQKIHIFGRVNGSSGNRVLDVRPKKENIGSNSREDIA